MKKLILLMLMVFGIVFNGYDIDALAQGNNNRFRKPVESIKNRFISKNGFTYGAGDYGRKLSGSFRNRFYEIHVPSSYDKSRPVPVVMVFHGGGSYPAGMRYFTNMDATSDREGFIVVYPAGTPATEYYKNRMLIWNDGRPFENGTYSRVDDVGYVEALLKDLAALFNIDKKKVYACGFSNGAQFTYRLAKRRSTLIAAIAVVAGQRPVRDSYDPLPTRPIPLMQFSGAKDKISPYNGGELPKGAGFKAVIEPVRDTVESWVDFNECPSRPVEKKRIGRAVMLRYGPCQGGSEVVFWTLEDGGHTWPGGRAAPNAEILGMGKLGTINRDINASDLMWGFFKKHF